MVLDKEKVGKELAALKRDVELEYKKLTTVFCPYLNSKVHFNTKGLDHIKFKEWKKAGLPQISIYD